MAKKRNSVQALIGLERFTRYGVKTEKAEVVLFAVEPSRTPYEQSNSAINRRFCYNESKSYSSIWRVALFL